LACRAGAEGEEEVRLSKIDVAEAHLVTAVRATFRGEHPASIYLLASCAREILTTIGSKTKVRTMVHALSEETGHKLGRVIEAIHEFAGSMKHADKDADAVLERFSEADILLFVACNDFGIIAKGKSHRSPGLRSVVACDGA
jgi:hypothetical protein